MKGKLGKVVGFNQFTLPEIFHSRPGPQCTKHCRRCNKF